MYPTSQADDVLDVTFHQLAFTFHRNASIAHKRYNVKKHYSTLSENCHSLVVKVAVQ